MEQLWRLGAGDLARLIRSKDVSVIEVTRAVLDRIDQVNPRINALPDVLYDDALAASRSADLAIARGDVLGPLHGVPVTTKINVDQVGCATTHGVKRFADNIALEDSPPVANLKKAGAIVVGRSNTPAFSLRWFTDNDLHGRTLNPWSSAVTPGGSSGGAAAALATGMGALAHGNDIGGSIRYPAYACGVVGLRPTIGRVPAFNATATEERSLCGQLMGVQGPLARRVADVRLGFEVLSGYDARDPLWVGAPVVATPEPKNTRVALFHAMPGVVTEPSVMLALSQASAWLADAGYQVEEAEPPDYVEACELWRKLLFEELRRSKEVFDSFGDAAIRTTIDFSLRSVPEQDRDTYLLLFSRRNAIARAWSIFHERYPLLLMPVSFRPPAAIDEDIASMERAAALTDAQGPLLCTAMLGTPGISVPTGIVDGLPTGVQLCGWRHHEEMLLRAAAVIEEAARAPTFAPDC
jgi:amidase